MYSIDKILDLICEGGVELERLARGDRDGHPKARAAESTAIQDGDATVLGETTAAARSPIS